MMTRKIKFIIIGILIGLFSCRNQNPKTLTSTDESSVNSLDSMIYKNYVYAVMNESTFQYFLVVKVKDLNTGQTREICTKGNFLEGAVHIEYKIDYDSIGIKKLEKLQLENRKRNFEFKDTSALNNIGINNYSIEELKEFEKKHNIDSLALEIKKLGSWGNALHDDRTMLLFAHSLFNRGILTGENNCFGGTLIYIPEERIKKEHKQTREMDSIMKVMNQKK